MTRRPLSEKTKSSVRRDSRDRCGYCLSPQDLIPADLQFDHIIPLDDGGTDIEENLWLLCIKCNRAKWHKREGFDKETRLRHPLFNPRTQDWSEHFEWSPDGLLILGKTPIGRVTVIEANLNNSLFIRVRRNWIKAKWHPPRN